MSLKINFVRINNDNTITNNPQYNNILIDLFNATGDILNDGIEPTIGFGNEEWEWSFTTGSGTNGGQQSTISPKTGQGPQNIVFYEEGVNTIHLKMTRFLPSTSGQVTQVFETSIDVDAYEMDTEIHGPEYIEVGTSNVIYFVKAEAQSYLWNNGSTNNQISIDVLDLRKRKISCTIIHGQHRRDLVLNITPTIGPTVVGTKYNFDVTSDLLFFNKEGDNLNFDLVEYSPGKSRWEGDLIFDPNSSETFKTIGLYTFEKVAPISISNDLPPEASTSGNVFDSLNLNLIKYQLFNEFGIDFLKSRESGLIVENIDIPINISGFYSKWIYGNNFHYKYRKGSEIWFENIKFINGNPLDFESKTSLNFNDVWKTFTVLDSKVDAILILTETENINWSFEYDLENPGRIYSANFVRVWNPDFIDPEWNEIGFRAPGLTGIYDKKKLTFINTRNNDGVYTVNFREDNENLSYKNKYFKIDYLNYLDLPAGFGLDVTLKFLTTRVFISNEPIDFIPKSRTNVFLNRKKLLFFEWSRKKDKTPTLLQDGTEFTFEPDGTNVNFNFIYDIIKKGPALSILDINESDRKGWFVNVESALLTVSDPPTIKIHTVDLKNNLLNDFNVILTNNVEFKTYVAELESTGAVSISNSQMTNLIQLEINSQSKGISTQWNPTETTILINETGGWKIQRIEILTTQNTLNVTAVENNPTNGKLPTEGLIGASILPLSENTVGFIYHRTKTSTIHIQVDYDSINQIPIWYTLDELQTTLWVNTLGNIVYQQNAQQPLYLTDTEVTFTEDWINDSLLSTIKIIDLDSLKITNPESPIFKNINKEIFDMFTRFVSNWKSTFDFYGLDLYIQTDTNKWDYDITYNKGEYIKFNSVYYQSILSNNKGNQPDQFPLLWKQLDLLILLCVARKYTINSNTINIPIITDDYIDIIYDGINYEFNESTSGIKNTIVSLTQTENYLIGYQFEVLEELADEFNHIFGTYNKPTTTAERQQLKVIIDDIDKVFGLTVVVNGVRYPVIFDDIPTDLPPDDDRAFDIQETLFDWGNTKFGVNQDIISPEDDTDIGLKYYQQLESLGIIVYLERSGEKGLTSGTSGLQPYDTLVFLAKYPNVKFTVDLIGTNNRHKFLHSDIIFFNIGNILTITINGLQLSITGATPVDTVEKWVEQYKLQLEVQEIIVQINETEDGLPIIEFFTLNDDTKLKYTIWVGINPLPTEPLYSILNYRPGNEGIILAGNEVLNLIPFSNFQNAKFATGMIVNIDGSKWALNNQEYNIILVDPRNIGLSYQGPFWNSSDIFGDSSDDIDTDPNEPGRQNFNWEDYSDPAIKFNVIDFLRLDRIDDNGNEIPDYQVTFEDQSNIGLDLINSWTWNFGDGSDSAVIPNFASTSGIAQSTSGFDSTGIISHVYKTTGVFTVSLKITFTIDSFRAASKVFIIENNEIIERGPRQVDDIFLQTREFLRYPREGYDDQLPITFRWTWAQDNIDDIFLYDFSGTQLIDEGILTYTGPKPLIANNDKVFLNNIKNNKTELVLEPGVQQTVFSELNFILERIDSEIDITFEPEPMQTFIGYNSPNEGVNYKTLLLQRIEPLEIRIETTKIEENNTSKTLPVSAYNNVINFISERNEIRIDRFQSSFIDMGIRPGLVLTLNGFDNSTPNKIAIFNNAGRVIEVENVGINWIKLTPESSIVDETTWKQVQNFAPPYNIITASLSIDFVAQPIEIGRFNIIGQTEIEDDRYRTLMYNMGLTLREEHTFIFKEYDINEKAVDWTFLNMKRKELLANFPSIYNYISSYKAVINAINFFGYNELEFNEYYRNIDENSENYKKLVKILIPDIFNNLVDGYSINDFIIGNMPTKRYMKTNLFNLTYRITDTDGNNVIAFSLDEIITKLLGLKKWLQDETIPIGRRILDITGKQENTHNFVYAHDSKNVTQIKINENISPVDFNVEAYLQPIVNNSETYNVHIEFFTVDNTVPLYFSLKILTFSTDSDLNAPEFELTPVQIIKEVRTDMSSYNFVADSNIDPFILIETVTDNGYGIIYKHKKTFSLQSFAFIS